MTSPSDFLRVISAIACLSLSRLVLRLGMPSEAPCQRPGVISSSGNSAANLCINIYVLGGASGFLGDLCDFLYASVSAAALWDETHLVLFGVSAAVGDEVLPKADETALAAAAAGVSGGVLTRVPGGGELARAAAWTPGGGDMAAGVAGGVAVCGPGGGDVATGGPRGLGSCLSGAS